MALKVKAGLITSRRIIFTLSVDLKEELAKTAVNIVGYDLLKITKENFVV